MRIIGGRLGGRRFTPPGKMPHTRPTTDLAKEGLFNIIGNNLEIDRLKTLDLFGGTGSISYELASRGAPDLTIVEKDYTMSEFIRRTAIGWNLEGVKIIRMDVFRFLQQCKKQFDLIFAGPPYALAEIDELPKQVFERNLLRDKGWMVLEHTPRNSYRKFPGFAREVQYGSTVFSIFVKRPAGIQSSEE